MIGAIVFDVGGVLCPNPLEEFARVDVEYGLPPGTTQRAFRGGDLFAEVETGRVPVADFYRACCDAIAAEIGVAVPPGRLDQMLDACMGDAVRAEMVELVVEIKERGYQTGLLTNIPAERRTWLHSIFDEGVIDAYCDSSEVGLRKPDEAIYHCLLAMLARPAGEVAFVDDFDENVAAAAAVGINAIRYESAAQVRAELTGLGVRLREEASWTSA